MEPPIILMINNLFFKITKTCSPFQTVAVCGNIPQLGGWDTSKAFRLQQESPDTWSNPSPLIVQLDRKIQFKIITLQESGQIQWESLPGDLNRRFRVSRDVLLQMRWSDSIGKKKYSGTKDCQSKPERGTSPQLERLLKSKPKKMAVSEKEQSFNPFNDAYNSDSESQCSQQKLKPSKLRDQKFLETEFCYLLLNDHKNESKDVGESKELIIASLNSLFENFRYLEIANNASKTFSKVTWVTSNNSQEMNLISQFPNIQFVVLTIQPDTSERQRLREFEKKLNQLVKGNSDELIVLGKESKSINLKQIDPRLLFEAHYHQYKVDPVSDGVSDEIQSYQAINSQKQIENFKKLVSYNPFTCEYKQFQSEDYEKSKSKSNHKLYIFDFDIFVKSSVDNEIEMDQQSMNKLRLIAARGDSCPIIYTEKTSEEIPSSFISELDSSPKVILIASNGLEVWFDKKWINIKSLLSKTFQSVKKCVRKYHSKHPGEIHEEDFLIEYSNPHTKIHPSLINQLLSLMNDKTLIQFKYNSHKLSITLPFKNSLSLIKVIQLRYLHCGHFDFVSTLVSTSNKKHLSREVKNLIHQCPSFFNRNVEQYHLSMGMDYFSLATHYILFEQWKNIQL